MVKWNFRAFQFVPTSRPLEDWKIELEIDSFNVFSNVIGRLEVLPRNLWKRPDFDVLHGNAYHGMGEIRFKGNHKVHRVFGWFGPGREAFRFTLLHACIKQRSDLTDEYEKARKRRDFIITNGEAYLYDFTLKREPAGTSQ
jgi:hypothetical protein